MVSERIPHRILERRLGVIAPLVFTGWYRDVVDAFDPPDHDVPHPDVAWTIRPSRNTTQAHSTSLASWRCRWHGWSLSGRELSGRPTPPGETLPRVDQMALRFFRENIPAPLSTKRAAYRVPSRARLDVRAGETDRLGRTS